MKSMLMSLLVLSLLSVSATATTVSLLPTDDTYGQYTNSNICGEREYIYQGAGGGSSWSMMYLGFDLSSIPAGSTIQSATLKLNRFYIVVKAGSSDMFGVKIIEPWSEHTLIGSIWHDDPTCPDNVPAVDVSYAFIPAITLDDSTLGWISWDATDAAKDWYANPITNYGVMMTYGYWATNTFNAWRSKEYQNGTQGPILEVTYEIPEPATMALLLIGAPLLRRKKA